MRCLLVATLLIAAGLIGSTSRALARPAEPDTATVWTVLEPVKAMSARGATLKRQPDGSLLVGGMNPFSDTYTITAPTRLTGITAIRLEVLPDASLGGRGPGRAFNGNFVLTAFRVSAAPRRSPDKSVPVAFRRVTADFSQVGFPVTGLSEPNPTSSWAVHPMFGKKHGAVFETKAPFGFAQGSVLTFTLEQVSQHPQHTIGRFRLSVTTAKPPVPLELLELSAKDLASAWADLAARDTGQAQLAVESLVVARQTVGFLKGKLKAAPVKVDTRRIAALVRELDHQKFAVRERATKELEKLGPVAAPALAQALIDSPSLEARCRASKLLDKVRTAPALLREQRAVEVLVRLGTGEARRLLEALAKGPPEAWLTQEARAGVERWGKGPAQIVGEFRLP
jgi:hypothetical protein